MTTQTQLKSSRRQLMMRDGAAFLILTAATGVLFAVTLFLFRSFSAHRADLATQAGEAGRVALAEHRPHDAIASLRVALSYAPDNRTYELLLAQALGDDGRLEEANSYFLNLRESQPGDGFINLQLARLAVQRQKSQEAIDYYRASIFGNWNGEGDVHRRDVRLELASYLVDQKQIPESQTELLIAASNAQSRSGDPKDAQRLYEKAMLDNPHSPVAFEKAGRLAYAQGDFPHATVWLERALHDSGVNPGPALDPESDTATLLKSAEGLALLSPAFASSRADRVGRELHNRALAKKRFDVCLRQTSSAGQVPAPMQALNARWTAAAPVTTREALFRDAENETELASLVGDTEILTQQLCGEPQGDDALLLTLAQRTTSH